MPSNGSSKNFTSLNRKLHIHIGLFLLLFIWLFSLSGLLLNHGQWKFTSFWDERKQEKSIRPVSIPATRDSVTLIKSVTAQLGLSGEVTNVQLNRDSLDFSINRPGQGKNVHVDFAKGISVQNSYAFNWWGKLRTLHTFNGAVREKPEIQPNWIITYVWRYSMDVIAIGLLYLCVSSWIMWYKIRRNYRWGPVVLLFGFAGAIYFVYLIQLI